MDSRWAHSCCGAPREEPLQLPAPSFLGACALRVSASAAKLSAGRRHRSLRRCPLSTDPRRWGRPEGASASKRPCAAREVSAQMSRLVKTKQKVPVKKKNGFESTSNRVSICTPRFLSEWACEGSRVYLKKDDG